MVKKVELRWTKSCAVVYDLASARSRGGTYVVRGRDWRIGVLACQIRSLSEGFEHIQPINRVCFFNHPTNPADHLVKVRSTGRSKSLGVRLLQEPQLLGSDHRIAPGDFQSELTCQPYSVILTICKGHTICSNSLRLRTSDLWV